MNKEIKEICEADNKLQKQLMHRQITETEFNEKIKSLHKRYSELSNEKALLERLTHKHNKPVINNSITLKEYDRVYRRL